MHKTPTVAAAAAVAVALAACGGSSSSSSTHATPPASATQAHTNTATPAATTTPFLAPFRQVTTVGSTVPPNGDLNPYGLAIIPSSAGALHAGNLLVSNFNAKSNNQGTGTTIVELTSSGTRTVFADIKASSLPGACPGGVGLTTALSIVPGNYVVVGSLPTTNGQSATAQYGCLIVLNDKGHPVSTIAGANIQGPWDMTAVTHGSATSLFVSNVLNGGPKEGIRTIDNSTVVRINITSGADRAPKVISEQVVVEGIPWRDDKTALAIGPTGVAVDGSGTLYVADTLRSAILAVPQALTRATAVDDDSVTLTHGGDLKQPLGLALAPNGDILTTNALNGDIVETSPSGKQLLTRLADAKTGAGSLFGLAPAPGGTGVYYVDDGANTLRILH
ncbi:MAG TPA: hypothetical protein VEF89_11480 [Solirubrobacteraceae bacterium]|nr:hypothetical protein [Solirubrobacteraceae bacterium]